MSFPFEPQDGLIIVPTRIWGPKGDRIVLLALDTGATTSVVAWSPLMEIGYAPSQVKEFEEVITGSAVEMAPVLRVRRIQGLGMSKRRFRILGHTLPPGATVDGVLGLDFLRKKRLTLDFRKGVIEID